MQEGWKCPNCGGAHAPWMPSCPDQLQTKIGNGTATRVDCVCARGTEFNCPNTACPRRAIGGSAVTVIGEQQ